MRNIILVAFTFWGYGVLAQYQGPMLLTDQRIQLECTEAVDSMYNFQFDVAAKQFRWLKQQYPNHPLPYFLLGLNEWWKIMPNDAVETYDETFLAYMDSSIFYAEEMYDYDEKNIEALFFLAASYGFKARLQSDRDQYTKAAFTAKQALNYLNESKELDSELSPEFLFGVGLYNYFREWIPENKKFLRPIILFFPKGDKEKGLEQLDKVAREAFYARIEAKAFQVMIYSEFEGQKRKAFPIIETLVQSYPKNAYFETYYAKLAFHLGKISLAEQTSLAVLRKYKAGYPGYTIENARKTAFFLGGVYNLRNDTLQAIQYYEQSISYATEMKAFDKGYYWYALEYLGGYYSAQGNTDKAIYCYEQITEHAPKKSKTYKKAKEYLKTNKKEKSGWFFF